MLYRIIYDRHNNFVLLYKYRKLMNYKYGVLLKLLKIETSNVRYETLNISKSKHYEYLNTKLFYNISELVSIYIYLKKIDLFI